MSLKEDRLSEITDAYVDGNIDEELLEELLDGIVRDEPPFYVPYVLKQPELNMNRANPERVRFFGYELEQSGDLYRECE